MFKELYFNGLIFCKKTMHSVKYGFAIIHN